MKRIAYMLLLGAAFTGCQSVKNAWNEMNKPATNAPVGPVTPPVTPGPCIGSEAAPLANPEEACLTGDSIGYKDFGGDTSAAWQFVQRQQGRQVGAGHVISCSANHGFWRTWVQGANSQGAAGTGRVWFGPTDWCNQHT